MATGVVLSVFDNAARDGDYTFNLRVDSGQKKLYGHGKDFIHCEIELGGEPRPPQINVPVPGMRVVVVGAWLDDVHAGWYEIHPVFYWSDMKGAEYLCDSGTCKPIP